MNVAAISSNPFFSCHMPTPHVLPFRLRSSGSGLPVFVPFWSYALRCAGAASEPRPRRMLNCTIDLPILDRLCIEKPPRTQAGCADALNVPEDSSVDEVARFAPSGERLGEVRREGRRLYPFSAGLSNRRRRPCSPFPQMLRFSNESARPCPTDDRGAPGTRLQMLRCRPSWRPSSSSRSAQ